ncbi:hypothetical protein CY34DRAFT_804108 [Suillus luteus UH-Slu-Lm8-n1]|uniref:Uncharacterized protein n=1 Tax=Suillus luteus UH-Slu-Lm8-n1 TaxID=930992 RepID=A0A0C9ZZU1_9AGAM|nr:hypothetical protein CY34DRAFT_804108 [Suillus luteus UH-Slu-Lm8-n1]
MAEISLRSRNEGTLSVLNMSFSRVSIDRLPAVDVSFFGLHDMRLPCLSNLTGISSLASGCRWV